MTSKRELDLHAAGLVLPETVEAVAQYVPFVRSGKLLCISGQLPRADGAVAVVGKVGDDVSIERARYAATICALRILSIVRMAAGSLDAVEQVIELTVYVNSGAAFTDHSSVADAASDVMEKAFGSAGRHARTAVGVAQLPKGAAVEISARFALDGSGQRAAPASATC
ncbi:RidA family protein [Paraburkholderia ferrariae]|jgi:enamine deaminase RidA (YjgF/YER057c/UK114 family)|uniref:RidA family protein n=1 Tax=Paraburkholderia ferrariae TaxID=386056 RepID=UPI0005A894F5|nr:RidA family protein [Paraburkholderia ferrariae]